jgi:hypothetical protein
MNAQRPNPEELFDRAVEAVRDEALDPQLVAAARDRVARRLAAELDARRPRIRSTASTAAEVSAA